ncbi:MAG: YdcF family protein [Lewinella sp.]|nr:YdcF family protein [Lewinella sp.]
MFFVLSKVLVFLIRPLIWVLLLLVGSWWLRGTSPWSGRMLVGAIVLLVLFTNRALFQLVAVAWEPRPIPVSEPYDVAIVLGGYLSEAGRLQPGPPEFSERADRLTAPIALYHQGLVKKLLLSGGAGTLFLEDEQPEATTAAQYALNLGVAAEDLLLDIQARNTYENALFSAELLAGRPAGERYLLVSSAWHLPRAAACFRKAGLSVILYPVDYLQSHTPLVPADYFLPRAQTLADWESLIKEWVGYLVYRLRGYA